MNASSGAYEARMSVPSFKKLKRLNDRYVISRPFRINIDWSGLLMPRKSHPDAEGARTKFCSGAKASPSVSELARPKCMC